MLIELSERIRKANNVFQFIKNSAKLYENKVAFTYFHNDEIKEINYYQFYEDVCSLGVAFIKRGIYKKKIALVAENSYEWILYSFASACTGNIFIPLDNSASLYEQKHVLEHCECDYLIFSKANQQLINEIIKRKCYAIHCICIEDDTSKMINLGRIIKVDPTSNFDTVSLNFNDCSYIFYTSGTTSYPKGVMQSEYNMIRSAMNTAQSLYFKKDVLLILPLHHIFAYVNVVLMCIALGLNIKISRGLKYLTEDFKVFKPNIVFMVPSMLYFFYKQMNNLNLTGESVFGGNLDTIIVGAAPIDMTYIEKMKILNIELLVGYGMTETCGSISVNPNGSIRNGSVGKINEEVEVCIADSEILIRAPNVMMGYYKDPEATKKAFFNGWLRTGDLGYELENYLYLTGRKKNLITLSNGKKICPEEIEEMIISINEVSEVQVCEKSGKLTAIIFPDYEINHVEEIIKSKISDLNRQLSFYKQIEICVFRDCEFPKNTSKKILRKDA